MSVTQTCRDINELKPVAQQAVKLLFQECYKAGVTNIFITETYRSQARQNYLYAQGRQRAGSIVTWTLNSNHTPRLAWDIACSSPSLYDNTTLNKVGEIAKKLGITWGGTWLKNMDKPHFEVTNNWKIPNGYKLEGNVHIPTDSKTKVSMNSSTKDYSKQIGFNIAQDAKAFRIHTNAFKSKPDAEKAKVEFVQKGYLAYAEVIGNDEFGYRLQSGKYNNQQLAENASKKMLDANVINYASVLGTKE